MSSQCKYLYGNSDPVAAERLRGLERIEDPSTLALLDTIGVALGWHCLDIGAGAGSIARWLAERVGNGGRVVATDIDTTLLDSGSYEVWHHDAFEDELPGGSFDLVHMRHVLIHGNHAKHSRVLSSILGTLKPGGTLLIEESDMLTWQVLPGTRDDVGRTYTKGIESTLSIYRSRHMDPAVGSLLPKLAAAAGFKVTASHHRIRQVVGQSEEARFHQVSAKQLAKSVRASNPRRAVILDEFARCFDESTLRYQTRATVAVIAMK